MKKLIFLLIAVATLIFQSVQSQESTTYDGKPVGYAESWIKYDKVGTTNDLLVGDSTWSYTVLKNSMGALKYDALISLDSIGGTKNNVVIKFQGKKFIEQTAWTDLKTVTWYNGHDTTILMTESSTAGQYQFYRTLVTGANDTFLAKILLLYIKFWE